MGHPSGPRLSIFQETDDRFSGICNKVKPKSRFLESLRKDIVTDAERLLVIVCARGADSDDVEKAGVASKWDFLIGEDESGDPQLCSQYSLLGAIPELKSKAATLLTASCMTTREAIPERTLFCTSFAATRSFLNCSSFYITGNRMLYLYSLCISDQKQPALRAPTYL